MKTEQKSLEFLTEKAKDVLRDMERDVNSFDIILEHALKEAFKAGQSNPKIKQLEWVDEPLPPPDVTEEYYSITPLGSKISMEAISPFGNCCIYENEGGTFDLWLFDDDEPIEVRFIDEAKIMAQADFEKRVLECLIIK